MTVRDDDLDMQDYTWADRLFAGEPVEDDGERRGVVAAVLATADRPAPAPNAALAKILREGLAPVPDCAPGRAQLAAPAALRQWSSRTVRVAAAALAATAAMAAGVATAEVSGVSTLDYVPEPVRRGVDAAVSAVADVFTADEPAPTPTPERDLAPAGPASPADSPATTGTTTGEPMPSLAPEPSLSPVPSPSVSVAPSPSLPAAPTDVPTTAAPTTAAEPSQQPSASPSTGSDREPLETPTESPTAEPSEEPTGEPSEEPSEEPTAEPTTEPSPAPVAEPTAEVRWERPEGPRRAEPGPA